MKPQLKEEIRLFLPLHEPFTRELMRNFFAKRGEVVTEQNLNVRMSRKRGLNQSKGLSDPGLNIPVFIVTINKTESEYIAFCLTRIELT